MKHERSIITCPDMNYENLDPSQGLTIRDIREHLGFRGPSGKQLTLQTLRRWSNPKRGCQPIGKDGPIILLPMLKINGGLITMPDWLEWFLEECKKVREEDRKRRIQLRKAGK